MDGFFLFVKLKGTALYLEKLKNDLVYNLIIILGLFPLSQMNVFFESNL